MYFTKMQGIGNDYIYMEDLDLPPQHPSPLAHWAEPLSSRHFGIGSDGLILVRPGQEGDFTMEMYNADGSRGAMCGNGIRCFGKYVYDRGLTSKTQLVIDTDAGPRSLQLHLHQNQVSQVTVDMGQPTLGSATHVSCSGRTFTLWPVQIGNPHLVLLPPHPEPLDLSVLGPQLSHSSPFPQGANVGVVQLASRDQLKLQVWERGSGLTLSCGTGACAALAAAASQGVCSRQVQVQLPGGALQICWSPETQHIFMTGDAVTVFTGNVSLSSEVLRKFD